MVKSLKKFYFVHPRQLSRILVQMFHCFCFNREEVKSTTAHTTNSVKYAGYAVSKTTLCDTGHLKVKEIKLTTLFLAWDVSFETKTSHKRWAFNRSLSYLTKLMQYVKYFFSKRGHHSNSGHELFVISKFNLRHSITKLVRFQTLNCRQMHDHFTSLWSIMKGIEAYFLCEVLVSKDTPYG